MVWYGMGNDSMLWWNGLVLHGRIFHQKDLIWYGMLWVGTSWLRSPAIMYYWWIMACVLCSDEWKIFHWKCIFKRFVRVLLQPWFGQLEPVSKQGALSPAGSQFWSESPAFKEGARRVCIWEFEDGKGGQDGIWRSNNLKIAEMVRMGLWWASLVLLTLADTITGSIQCTNRWS